MDPNTLVENQIEDGQKLVEQLPQRGFDVTTAVWLQKSENGKWYFYLVSPVVDSEGMHAAYGRLHPLVWEMPQPFWIDPLKIRLIGPNNPIAQDVIRALRLATGPQVCPVRWGGRRLGDLSIEAAYLYPLAVTAP